MYLCVYINIIRTQPEWTFSINRNMLLGLILKRTFSIKRNLARALYRSSCRRRWQHRTWCSTLKWIKVTAGNSTLLSMVDAPPSVLPVPHFFFLLYTSCRSCALLRSFISVSSAYIPFPRTPSLLLSRSSLFVSISLALSGPGFLSSFLSLARPPPLLVLVFLYVWKLWCMFWCGLHSVK